MAPSSYSPFAKGVLAALDGAEQGLPARLWYVFLPRANQIGAVTSCSGSNFGRPSTFSNGQLEG